MESKTNELKMNIQSVDIQPNPAKLTDGLTLNIHFELSNAVDDAFWTIKYIVDTVRKRHVIQVGETKCCDYDQGKGSMHFEVDEIAVDGLKASTLSNCGLLVASLQTQSEHSKQDTKTLVDVQMVVQVSKHKSDDSLHRRIFSPLE